MCVGCPNEASLHIVDFSGWVHQVLVVFAFNLDDAHYNSVDHVDGFALVVLTFAFLMLNNFASIFTFQARLLDGAISTLIERGSLSKLVLLLTSIDC